MPCLTRYSAGQVGVRERAVPRYRLKILCDIELPVRDDAGARLKALEAIYFLNIHHVSDVLGITAVATTLVCEEAKDGRNLLAPDSAS